MKRITFLMFLVMSCSLLLMGLYHFVTAQDSTVPESAILDSSFGKVTFLHKTHSSVGECRTCHHTGNINRKCETCHTPEARVDAKSAFHKNCIKCHNQKNNENKGPIQCIGCHKK